MMRLFSRELLFLSFLAVSLFTAAEPAYAQFTQPKQTELRQALVQLLNEGKLDEAASIVRKHAAEPKPSPDIAEAILMVARFYYRQEKYDESLSLLQEITDQFPGSGTASLAWCGMGQVYGKLGDNAKMIAALERGMSASRVWTETNIMDASDTHNYACEVLGGHYIKTEQWSKALKCYSAWKPSSWCGTCLDSMKTSRANRILLCQAHLAQFRPAITQAWRELASSSNGGDQLGMFLLVRLYAEAGQLDDLQLLNLALVEKACQKYSVAIDPKNQYHMRAIIKKTSALSDAIDSARQNGFAEEIDALQSKNLAAPVVKHVARWCLLRDERSAVHSVESAVRRSGSDGSPFLELLAAMNSPASHQALVDLACSGDVYRQQYICGLIRYRMKESKSLIDQIVARVPEDRRTQTNWNLEPIPFAYHFYETWPRPGANSLPKSLPDDLFEEKE